MATVARRTPIASRSAGPAESSGYRGAAAMRAMEEEEKRGLARKEASSQMAGMPYRFYCGVGDTKEVIVVDERPDFCRYEHNLENTQTGRFDIFTACINENANCPVCKKSKRPSYFGMFLTVIDLTPYTNKDGDEVPWSKKLLVVKPAQQKKIMRLFERHGSLRGMVLKMTRDGEKDAAIGNDIEEDGFVEEADLLDYVTVYVDKKNVEHEVLGYEPFDYDELFPLPSEESLRAIVGGSPEPGSRDGDRRSLGGSRGGDRGGSRDGWDDGPRGARPGVRRREPEVDDPPARSVRRAAAPVDDEPAPARGVVRRRSAEPVDDTPADDPPTRAPARRLAVAGRGRAEPEDAGGDDPAYDDAPQRPAARTPLRRAAAAPIEQEAPARNAASLADRRRALRR